VQQSPESPSGAAPPPKHNDIAGFIIGIVLGLGVGGSVLTLIVFWLVAALVSSIFKSATPGWFAFFAVLPSLGLAWWAIMRSRKALNFVAGALIGLAAGLLGGVSLCSLMFSGNQ
jgi:uncharacterized membrane protein YeiH